MPNCGQILFRLKGKPLGVSPLKGGNSTHTLRRGVLEDPANKMWEWAVSHVSTGQQCHLAVTTSVSSAASDKLSVLSVVDSFTRNFVCHIITSASFCQETLLFLSV